MTGGTFSHAGICRNGIALLTGRLKGGPCQPMTSDMRVHTPSGLDTYPDLSLLCGEPELTDGERTLLNPVALFEVLSPTTAGFDRGDKFLHYRSIPGLRDYVLVDSERRAVEHFRRAAEARDWLFREYLEPDEVVRLSAVDCPLPLAGIYEGVRLARAD
jgi:Uma2 family endonuclease